MIRHVRNAGFILLLGASVAGQAEAQTMYRCGKQFQDRPCDAGQPSRTIGNANPSAATAAANPALPRECAERGHASMKISWARESGVTLDAALAQARDQALVRDVYQKRGSAADVRAAIESDCQAEKEKEAKTAAALKALGVEGRSAAGAPAPATGTPQFSATSNQEREEAQRQANAQQAEARKAERCNRLNADLQRIQSQQRAGGNAAAMESLTQRRARVQSDLSQAGC
jgi:hypothetical protein